MRFWGNRKFSLSLSLSFLFSKGKFKCVCLFVEPFLTVNELAARRMRRRCIGKFDLLEVAVEVLVSGEANYISALASAPPELYRASHIMAVKSKRASTLKKTAGYTVLSQRKSHTVEQHGEHQNPSDFFPCKTKRRFYFREAMNRLHLLPPPNGSTHSTGLPAVQPSTAGTHTHTASALTYSWNCVVFSMQSTLRSLPSRTASRSGRLCALPSFDCSVCMLVRWGSARCARLI